MSGILSPKMPGMNQNIFLGIQFQSSNYGVALPLLYGTQRIPGKMVDYDDFQIIPNSSPVGKGGGVAVYSYTYLCGALLALCEGPVTGINRVWSNTQVLTLAGLSATMSGGISFYYGTQPQSPWPYWTGKHPNKSIGYAGIAYLGAGQWNLGSSAAMPNNNFEVTGLLATEVDSTSRIYLGQGTGSQHSFYLLDPNGNYITNMAPYPAAAYFVNGVQVLSGYTIAQSGSNWALSFTTPPANGAIIQWSTFLLALDAKPSAVLIDFLTSPNHGVPGWSAADIADNVTGPSSWQSYCNAMQFTVSPYYDSQKAASDWIQDLLTATNSEAVLHAGASGAQLQVVPYGDQGVTGPVNSLVADGSFLTGLYYQIVYAGNTAWTSYGAPSSNPGTLFQASSAGGSGSGLALPVLLSGVAQSAAGSWTIGTVYMILTLGSASNATWNTAMGTSGVTPVAATVQSGATVATGGTVFTAANNGSACTGAVVIQVNVALLSVNGHGVVYQGGIMGQLVVGNLYQIATNTSNAWTQVGAINNNVGTIFQATGTGYSPGPQGTNRLGSDTANGVTLGSGTGSAVTAGSFSIGQVYQILIIGTTNFNNCGFVGTPAVSGIFTATTAGSGTGTAAPVQVTLLGAPSTYAGNFIVGNIYQITFAGTTSWTSIGAANNNVGTQFIATGVGSGTGSATLCTTYVPNTTALYNLTYDDFIGAVEPHGEVTDDPIKIERSANSETYNTIPVEFLDRQNAYNISTVQDPDPVNYALYGTTKGSSLSLHLITRMTHAQILSRIAAQRSVYIRRAFKFKTSWKYMLLEPMDLITLTDPKIGINQLMVRVTSVTFPDKDSEDGGLEIEAEEWPFGVGHAAIGNGQGSTSGWVNTAADPGPVAVPVILDVPALASVSGNPEILIACAGAGWGSSQGNAYWGGADVWISLDGGASYVFEGTINGPCHYGSLMSNLTSTAVGTVAQFDFTLSNDSTSLQSVTTTTAQDGATPVWINGEVVDYSTISLAGTSFQYNATLAVRGAYGTTAATQSAGAPVVALDGVPFRWQVPNSLIGVPIYVKLVSANLWGFNGNQTLANTTAYAHTPAGAGTSGGDYMNPISLVPNFNSQYGPVSGIAGVGVLNTSGLAFPGYAGSPYVRAQQALPSGWNAITNPIPCQAGDVFNYNDQATCTVNNSSTWPYVLQVEFYGASGTDLGSGILADGLSYLKEHVVPMGGWVAGTWYWDAYQATAPANAAYCVCSLYGLGGAGSSDYWVSDIILTKQAYVASSGVLGPVKVGNGLTVAGDGTVSTTLEALLASPAAGEGDALIAGQRPETGAVPFTLDVYNMLRIINVKTDFGAKGDGVTDDTTAINAALATNKSIYFPLGTYNISSDLVFSAQNNTAGAGRVIFGESMGDVFAVSTGVNTGLCHGSVIRQTASGRSCFYNTDTLPYFTIRDLCMVGGPTTDRGIYCTGTAAQCRFDNLNIYVGKQAIYLPQPNGTGYGAAFANLFINCHGSSWTTSVFEVAGGPGTNFFGCYAHNFPGGQWINNYPFPAGTQILNNGNLYTCTVGGTSAASGGPTGTGSGIIDGTCTWNYLGVGAPGIAGFRIYSTAILTGCNSVDLGGNAAIVGQYTVAGDSVNTQCFVAFNGCNFENFNICGCEVRGLGTATFRDCAFVEPVVYTASLIQNTPIANVQPIVLERCQFNNSYAGAQWLTARLYGLGAVVQNVGNLYVSTTNPIGTSGGSAPVHGSGSVSDGGVTWKFLQAGAASRAKRSELYVQNGSYCNFVVFSSPSLGAQPQADYQGSSIFDCPGSSGIQAMDGSHVMSVESGKFLNGPLVLTAPPSPMTSLAGGISIGGIPASNAAVAVTLGSTGPTGSTAGAPQGWLPINVAGTNRYVPFW